MKPNVQRPAPGIQPPRWNPPHRALLLLATVVALGGIATWQVARQADREMRARLLTEAHMVAQAVELRQVLALSGSEADLANVDYQRLKEQLVRVRSVNSACRFIYLTGRRLNGPIFFADSESPESKDYSPPGQTYTEAPAAFARAFAAGEPVTEGPFTDRWGTWVSGVVPLADPQTRTLIAVLGMDVDARRWNRTIAARCVAPVSVTALILLMLVVFILIHDRAARDLSERKRTEKELQSSRAFLDRVINAIADPVFVKDAMRRFVLVNDALCAIVGRPREQLLGADGDDMFPREQVDVFRQMDARVLDTGEESLNEEALSNLSSGEVRTIVTRKSRYIDPAGKRFLVGVIRDITERKRAEAQLQQQAKLASIGTLARGMAHEINNPIMGIMNYAQLVSEKLGPESPVAEFTTEIGKEAEHIATLVQGLLTFSQQEQETHRSLARLHDIVARTLALIQPALHDDGIALAVDVAEDLPQVKCGVRQIQQVIMNLLTNARDALNEKYPGFDEDKKIRVSAEVVSRQSSVVSHQLPEKAGSSTPITDHRSLVTDTIRLTVEDHGKGIPAELRERIFDPFFTTKDRTRNAGMGLAVSHGIVKDHDGALSVESEPGRWTRFHVDLPIADCEERNAE